jgi:ABC-type dipeptide/oligopeptide/nickel transport system permease subunit
METTENLLSQELQIDSTSQGYLAETAKWGTFLSILGFIISVIIGILAIFVGTIFGSLSRGFGDSNTSAMTRIFITVFYLIIAVVNFFMSFYLFKFSSKMKAALYANDQDSLNESFKNQRSMFRLIGILTATYIGLLVLALVFGGLAAAFG